MATELIGTIHQFRNNCKDTIVSWCKDAAKTVCLPLTGGTISGNVTVNGTTNLKGVTTVDSTLNAKSGIFRSTNDGGIIQTLAPGEAASDTVNGSIVNVDIGWKYSTSYGPVISFRSSKYVNNPGRLDLHTRTPDHTYILSLLNDGKILWDGPTPANTDSTNHLATTRWVQNVLANMTKGYNTSNGTRYIKFPNGLMICAGYAANVTAGTIVNFPVAFKNMPDVVATRHWGGTGDASVGASSVVGSVPVHVYSTTTASFRIGVHTNTSADATAYLGGNYTIYAMWVAVGEWK